MNGCTVEAGQTECESNMERKNRTERQGYEKQIFQGEDTFSSRDGFLLHSSALTFSRVKATLTCTLKSHPTLWPTIIYQRAKGNEYLGLFMILLSPHSTSNETNLSQIFD